MTLLCFLDLDGVLRRESAPRYRLERHLVERFEIWLREQDARYGSVEIVISSSWKDAFSLEEIRRHFDSAYVALRIRAVTPTLTGERSFPRYDEVRAYLKAADALDADYIVIDDQPAPFPAGLKKAIWCRPEEGFR